MSIKTENETENDAGSRFEEAILSFFSDLESLHTSHRIVGPMLYAAEVQCRNELKSIVEKHTTETEEDDGSSSMEFPDHRYLARFLELAKDLRRTERASELVRRGVLVNMVSQFDALVGQLIRAMYRVVPEKLNSSERNVTLSELISAVSVDSVIENLIEKEVETRLRASHPDQFAWLEKAIDTPLTKDLPSWSAFIEITERRNLYVHADGKVSDQYLKICAKHGVPLSADCRIGTQLEVEIKYLDDSYNTLAEIGIKLGQVMWRKLAPNELDEADTNLNTVAIELIKHQEYGLAERLLEFSSKYCSKRMSERNSLNMILNQAQNFKWSGRSALCSELLSGIDWAAKSNLYQLAYAVLQDDFENAGMLMVKVGSDLTKLSYIDWPIFKDFRTTVQFAEAYKKIFGTDFLDLKEFQSLYSMARSNWKKTKAVEELLSSDTLTT
jgi:hypothetical protein